MTNAQSPSSHCPSCQQAQPTEEADFCLHCRFPLVPVANKYRLEQLINEGGSAHVYLARHIRLKRNAERVIKIIKGDLLQRDPKMEERFYSEVQMTSDLSHQCQHVVRVYDDFGEAPKLGHYYVMEYLQGGTLAELLEASPEPLSLELAIHIASQLCDAMYWAHETGILHRDLKPANVMLIDYEGDPHYVKLLDFGIAKSFAEEHSQDKQHTQGAIGTPTYMAPEHFTGGDIDFRADIYALGVIFYELLAGRPPFERKKTFQSAMIEMMDYHLKAMVPPLQDFRPDVPDALAAAINKALEKRAESRYASARDFKAALQEGLQAPAPQPTPRASSASLPAAGVAIPPPRPTPPPPTASGSFPASTPPLAPSGSFASASGSYASTGSKPPPPPPRRKTGTYASTPSVPPPPPTGSHASLASLPAVSPPPTGSRDQWHAASPSAASLPGPGQAPKESPSLADITSPLVPLPKVEFPPASLPPKPFKSTAEFTPPTSPTQSNEKISLRLDNRLVEGAQITMDPQAEPLTADDIEELEELEELKEARPARDLSSTGVLTAEDLATESRQSYENPHPKGSLRNIPPDLASAETFLFNTPQVSDIHSANESASENKENPAPTETNPGFLASPTQNNSALETTHEEPKSDTSSYEATGTIDPFAPSADRDAYDTAIQPNPFLEDPLLREIATASKAPALSTDDSEAQATQDGTAEHEAAFTPGEATPPGALPAITKVETVSIVPPDQNPAPQESAQEDTSSGTDEHAAAQALPMPPAINMFDEIDAALEAAEIQQTASNKTASLGTPPFADLQKVEHPITPSSAGIAGGPEEHPEPGLDEALDSSPLTPLGEEGTNPSLVAAPTFDSPPAPIPLDTPDTNREAPSPKPALLPHELETKNLPGMDETQGFTSQMAQQETAKLVGATKATPAPSRDALPASKVMNLAETAYFHPTLPGPKPDEQQIDAVVSEMVALDEESEEETTALKPGMFSTDEYKVMPPGAIKPSLPGAFMENKLAAEADALPESSTTEFGAPDDTDQPQEEPSGAPDAPEQSEDERDYASLLGEGMYHQAVTDDEGLLSIDSLPDTPTEPTPSTDPAQDFDEDEGTLNISNFSLDGDDPFGLLNDEPATSTEEQTPPDATPTATLEPPHETPVFGETVSYEDPGTLPPTAMLVPEPDAHSPTQMLREETPPSAQPSWPVDSTPAPQTAPSQPSNETPEISDPFAAYAPAPTDDEAAARVDPNEGTFPLTKAVPPPPNNLPIVIIMIAGGVLLLIGAYMMLQ